MAELPTEKERDARVSLADALDRRQIEIQRRFREGLEQRRRGDASVLADLLHEYLARLAQELRGRASVASGAAAAWRDLALEHGLARVREGFDVERLLQELTALRRATIEALNDGGSARQTALVGELFEAAAAEAVRSYVDARDRETRRMRAAAPRVVALPAAIDVQARMVEVALGEILSRALGLARSWAEDKGIPLMARFDPEVVLWVDPGLTLVALEAVLGNAVKFTDEGGVTVEVEDRPEDLIVHVRDNCDGLSPEELGTLFEAFPRRHSRKPGNGAALASARRALVAQGGTISATSDGEHGCHFCVILPKARH